MNPNLETHQMNRHPNWPAILAALLLLQVVQASDRGPNDWANLSLVAANQRVEIIDKKLKRTRGEFLRSSPEELQVKTPAGLTVIPKAQVFRVSLLGKSTRRRNVLIGLAIGAAAGLAAGAAIDSSFSEDDEHVAKMLFVPIGIGAGAGLGAAAPAFETIYRAPKQ